MKPVTKTPPSPIVARSRSNACQQSHDEHDDRSLGWIAVVLDGLKGVDIELENSKNAVEHGDPPHEKD
jgi:hypothetical protein